METKSTTSTNEVRTEEHSMGHLLENHKSALSSIIISSLVLGLPLMINALWHLRVSSNASGRGVLRLIKLHYCINFISIPALVIELVILAMPDSDRSMPNSICLYLEWSVGFVRLNHYLGGLAIALSRLYYLFHGPTVKLITEANIIKILYWYSPLLSALTMFLHIIESIFRFFPNNPMLFYYSFCKKSPFPSDMIDDVVIFKMFVTIIMAPSLIAEMCVHIAVLVKQTKIENNAEDFIVKNDQRVSRQRHQRNVISAVGHSLSFALSMTETGLIVNAFYFLKDLETVTTVRNLNMFLIPSINFFVYPLIETAFSENLRQTFC